MDKDLTLDGDLGNVSDSQEVVLFLKPKFLDRIKSMMVDGVVIIFLLYLTSILISTLSIESELIKAIIFIITFLYEPILVSVGGTIGQRLLNIQVCNLNKYKNNQSKVNVNLFVSLWRYIWKLLLGWISLLTIHSNPYGQAIHDKFANSVMVNRK